MFTFTRQLDRNGQVTQTNNGEQLKLRDLEHACGIQLKQLVGVG
jgi:hypothetical protein